MNNFQKALGITCASLLLFIAGCSKEDDNNPAPEPNDIISIAQEEGDLDIFSDAIIKTGLRSQLMHESHTVFAPLDKIFQNYFDDIGVQDVDAWINVYGEDLVKKILLYHIIKGPEIKAEQVGSSFVSTAAQNKRGHSLSLYTARMDTIVKLNGKATVTQRNIQAENGVIHKIDLVLTLPSISALLEADPSFSLMRSCLKAANGNINTLLRQENEQFSFFVTTNNGFIDYYNDHPAFNDYTGFTQYYSSSRVRDFILYHLLNQSVRSDGLKNRSYNTALAGQSLSVAKDSHGNISLTDSHGNKADVVFTDITAMNGVIHSIDYLISPQ